MKHLNKLIAALLFSPFLLSAQSHYKPGYVVTTKGDTIRGFIDYQPWDSNPASITFKAAMTDRDTKTFTLHNISYFDVTGLTSYKKYLCSISLDEVSEARIGGRDTSFKMDTVFIKVLQKGKNVALYSYTDNLKTRFYVGEAPDFAPQELVYRFYSDAQGKTVNENTWQKQLFALANKYNVLDENLTATLEGANYNSGDLLTIVTHINKISKSEFDKKYAAHSSIGFYAGAALNATTTSSSSASSYSQGGGPGHTSYLPAIKLGFDVMPDVDGRIEFKADVSANFAQFNTQYKLKVYPYLSTKASYNQLSIAFTPQILYHVYNTTNFKFYLGVGFSLGNYSYTNSYFGSPGSSATSDFPVEQYVFSKDDFPFVLKAGVIIHKNIELYFDYYTSATSTSAAYFSLNNQMTQVGLNYYFGR
jgi:hypothetical protein